MSKQVAPMQAKAIEFLQKVYLRGLEGLIQDHFLMKVIQPGRGMEALQDSMEARYMAEQWYAQLQGRGL